MTLAAGSYGSGPAVANGVCATGNPLNWGDGDHTQPCGGYFPLVRVAGDATLTGTGQGVLLVDGDLNVAGKFQWFGAVIVEGAMKAAGGGNVETKVWGIALVNEKSTLRIHGEGSGPPPGSSAVAGTIGYMAPETLRMDGRAPDPYAVPG